MNATGKGPKFSAWPPQDRLMEKYRERSAFWMKFARVLVPTVWTVFFVLYWTVAIIATA